MADESNQNASTTTPPPTTTAPPAPVKPVPIGKVRIRRVAKDKDGKGLLRVTGVRYLDAKGRPLGFYLDENEEELDVPPAVALAAKATGSFAVVEDAPGPTKLKDEKDGGESK